MCFHVDLVAVVSNIWSFAHTHQNVKHILIWHRTYFNFDTHIHTLLPRDPSFPDGYVAPPDYKENPCSFVRKQSHWKILAEWQEHPFPLCPVK